MSRSPRVFGIHCMRRERAEEKERMPHVARIESWNPGSYASTYGFHSTIAKATAASARDARYVRPEKVPTMARDAIAEARSDEDAGPVMSAKSMAIEMPSRSLTMGRAGKDSKRPTGGNKKKT